MGIKLSPKPIEDACLICGLESAYGAHGIVTDPKTGIRYIYDRYFCEEHRECRFENPSIEEKLEQAKTKKDSQLKTTKEEPEMEVYATAVANI